MVKVSIQTVPLDKAVAAFLQRIVEEGNALNYIAGYSFDRSTHDANTVTIKLYIDQELAQFGSSKE